MNHQPVSGDCSSDTMKTPSATRLVLLGCLLGFGCGTAVPEVAEIPVDRLAPTTLYPMLENAQWVYDVDTGGGEPPTLGIFEVVERQGDTAQIANNRGMDRHGQVTYGDPIGYTIEEQGIRHIQSDGWLLRRPIEADAEWPSLNGRTARVTNIDMSAEVFSGTYEHCVEVTETGDQAGRTIRTVYCPQVGPVIIESSLTTQLTMREVSTRASLRSYDDGAAGDEL